MYDNIVINCYQENGNSRFAESTFLVAAIWMKRPSLSFGYNSLDISHSFELWIVMN